MKTTLRLNIAAFILAAFKLSAATHYVSLDSPNPTPPYTNWATAATNIQDAVDAAKDGDTVLVTNGVYAVGDREIRDEVRSMGMSRVVVTNSVRLESVNGPLVTAIVGSQLRDEHGQTTSGIRGVYLGTNAVLSGFTVTNGATPSVFTSNGGWDNGKGGGVYCDLSACVTNCNLTGNLVSGGPPFAGKLGGGVYGGTLNNCTLAGNSVLGVSGYLAAGGGAAHCTLNNCTLTANSAAYGGGAYESTLNNCIVTGNVGGGGFRSTLNNCTLAGNCGGAILSTLYNCTLTANSAEIGGGVNESTLFNCTVTGNSANYTGGGAILSTLYNCTLTANSAEFGGGVADSTLFNCTVTGNSASDAGGGAGGSTLYNCIVYYNTAANGPNYSTGTNNWQVTRLQYCCTAPLPTNGVGNITGPPLFMDLAAGDFRLWEGSPCIDAGMNLLGFTMTLTNTNTDGSTWTSNLAYNHDPTDILGDTRFIDGNGDGIVAWDIGAYEFNSFKPPRFIGAPQRTVEGWKFTIMGPTNKWIGLQRTSDFTGWWNLQPPSLTDENGMCHIVDADTGPKIMFYRAVVQ